MSGIWGNHIQLSIFGESHGKSIGITLNGLPAGLEIDMVQVMVEMRRRAPGRNLLSTQRKEVDAPEILSGYFNQKTTGTPLCAIIQNKDTRSKDYGQLKDLMRPSHGDFAGAIKYGGHNDYRGGGHFSGRITAPLVFAGAVCKQVLAKKGIYIGAHINSIRDIKDQAFDPLQIPKELLDGLYPKDLPLLDPSKEEAIKEAILDARKNGDSVGGTVECAIIGLEAGLGDPFFHSVESTLAQLLFSVPAVKGVEFGAGFEIASMYGSEANDELYYEGDAVKTKTNHNGGVTGGITNGMPIVFTCAIKPTSSIGKPQQTINLATKTQEVLEIKGRHDPCIVQRALPVIEAVAAIGMLELVTGRKKELGL